MNTSLSLYTIFKESILQVQSDARIIQLCIEKKESIDILEWLLSYEIEEQFYFKTKDSTFEIAGLGNTLIISDISSQKASNEVLNLLQLYDQIGFFCGFNFDQKKEVQKEWKNFGKCKYILPFVEYMRKGNRFYFRLNYYTKDGFKEKQKHNILEKLKYYDTTIINQMKDSANIKKKFFIPERKEWMKVMEKVLRTIQKKKLDKIVMSRKIVLKNEYNWTLTHLGNILKNIKEDSYFFIYKIQGDFFIGRSPERLFKIEQNTLFTDAIAGTRKRGKTIDEDRRLYNNLKNSQKDIHEHRLVCKYIENILQKHTSSYQTRKQECIMQLQNLQHLFTQYQGTLKKDISFFELLSDFHPTPAVGGVPCEKAKAIIRELEPFDRGWFASPVGWVSKEYQEFAVGIRSALAQKKTLHIYAGAGIVEGSVAEKEWEEIENKMRNFIKPLEQK